MTSSGRSTLLWEKQRRQIFRQSVQQGRRLVVVGLLGNRTPNTHADAMDSCKR